MSDSAVEGCQELLQHQFADRELLRLALTHASIAPTRLQSNERLEFLGDAVLGLVICEELYANHPDLLEGEMTKIKSTVVSRRTCAEVSREIGLVGKMLLGKGIDPDDLPQSVEAALMESIIGALYVDGGLDPARRFILEHFRDALDDAIGDRHRRNYKSILQQHVQKKLATTPTYHLLDEKGPDHSKAFEISVSFSGRHFPSAWGVNKKEAEQRAARAALEELGLVDAEEEALEPGADADD